MSALFAALLIRGLKRLKRMLLVRRVRNPGISTDTRMNSAL